MKYKMIACDLDGTLLNSSGELSSENYDAISEICSKGILFIPTTGRAFYETPASIRNHPSVRYFISSDGASIRDLSSGEHLEFLLDGEIVKKICTAMTESKVLPANHRKNRSYTDVSYMNDESMTEYNISPYFKNQLLTCTEHMDNFEEEFMSGEPCEMLSGTYKSKEDFDLLISKIKDIEGIHCTSAMSGAFEIVSDKAGKQNAVKLLMEKLGISVDEVITVGDSNNDTEMIKLVPNSFAMANAVDSLKEIACHIGCYNDEHIARYLLDNFINKNN